MQCLQEIFVGIVSIQGEHITTFMVTNANVEEVFVHVFALKDNWPDEHCYITELIYTILIQVQWRKIANR